MNTTANILDTLHEKADDFKAKAEELSLRTSLGRNEAAETFERECRSFSTYLQEKGNRLRRMGYFSNHLLDELEDLLPELQSMLAAPTPDQEKNFPTWREQLMRSIYEVEFIIKELYPTLDVEGRELFSRLRIKLELYRTRMVITAWQDLGKLSAEATAVRTICEETLAWRERNKEAFKTRIENFGQGVRGMFDQMKGTVREFFK